MPEKIQQKVISWAQDLDDKTQQQAINSASLPFVWPHVALMADAHYGYGSTVGSVIPTKGAIMPSCIGVDIGCGMIATKLNIKLEQLPDNLDPLLLMIEVAIPAGPGGCYSEPHPMWNGFAANNFIYSLADDINSRKKSSTQFGTLGSGNHFIEICTDEGNYIWAVIHSGSRGIGKDLATLYIDLAKGDMKKYFISLPDPDLAYLVEGTEYFDKYIKAMLWAQSYAAESRSAMMASVLIELRKFLNIEPYLGFCLEHINCHHNYCERENHFGSNLWVTRKGAIRAREGDRGIIPGSMGASSFIVTGLGNKSSICSASHGAGRVMSRNEARKKLTVESLNTAMSNRSWLKGKADDLLDEHPLAYKNIDDVMAAQNDLVRIDHKLTAILNYKGV